MRRIVKLAEVKDSLMSVQTGIELRKVQIDNECDQFLYERHICSIKIPKYTLISSPSTLADNYQDAISKAFLENGILCTLVSKHKRFNNQILPTTPKLVIYLECMHRLCREYKLEIFDIEAPKRQHLLQRTPEINQRRIKEQFSQFIQKPCNKFQSR